MRKPILISSLTLLIGSFLFAGEFLIVGNELSPSSLCLPLSGNPERTIFAVDLYKNKTCEKLLFLGGYEGRAVSYAASQQEIALDRNVLPGDIALDETDIYSTYDEVTRLKNFIGNDDTEQMIVTMITDPTHTRRLRMTARWVLGDSVNYRIIPIPYEEESYGKWWWLKKKTRRMVVQEYRKILFYIFRHGVDFPMLNRRLSVFDRFND